MSCPVKFDDEFTAGDLRPDLVFQFPYDITGHTITLRMKRPSPSPLLIKTAVITDAESGQGKFVWAVGDLVAGGNQQCEIRDVDADNRPLTSEKFTIDVEPPTA